MNNIIIEHENDIDKIRGGNIKGDTKVIIRSNYIDSEFIANLHHLGKELNNGGYKIEIEVKTEPVLDILELVGITSIWDVKFNNNL